MLTTHPQAAGRETLLERARALVPRLAERSAEAETLRRCPDETIADFEAAGLLRVCQPERYGGFALGWDVLCEVSQTLARGCGSQAWVQNIFCDHAQKLGTFPSQAQDDVWAEHPTARVSSSFDPVGTARRVEGGVMYSGRHAFSSGVDHAHWVICGGHVYAGGQREERCFFLVPASAIRIIDDWHVAGFAGTGSKSFEVREVFVPQHRIAPADSNDDILAPGLAPVYRLPRAGIAPTAFAAVAVGIAEGFIANYIAYTRPRKSRGVAVAELHGTQIALGAALAEVHAAETIYLDAARAAMQALERGETIAPELKLRAKRDSGYAAQLALGAVTRLFNAAGGRALSLDNPMQRQYRDLVAAASHHALVWDNVAADYGRFALGG